MTDYSNSHFLNEAFEGSGITNDELKIIIPKYRQVNFCKNDFLLREGQVQKKYWIIESGFVRSYIIDRECNDITFNLYASKDTVIDYPSLFFCVPTKENIQALKDCVCWEAENTDFKEMFDAIPSFRAYQRGLLKASYFALKEYTSSFRLDSAKTRYLKLLKEKPHVVQNVSLKLIATYLGITDTSLSRIRKEILSNSNFLSNDKK